MQQDDLGRPELILFADGTDETRVYGCCGLENTTGRDDITTYYERDALKRPSLTERAGIGTRYEYDAAGRRTAEIRVGMDDSETVLRENDYNLAGRLVEWRDALDHTTEIEETYGPDGKTVTTTRPDGSTVVEAYYRDGRLRARSGTGTAPVLYEYGIDSTGEWTREIRPGPGGAESEWVKTWTDGSGRTVLRRYADGATETMEYDAAGRLAAQTDADGVTRLYGYTPTGEREYEAVDRNGNGVIDPASADEITRTTREVVERTTPGGDEVVERTTTSVFAADDSAAETVVSVVERTPNGRQVWRESGGRTESRTETYDGLGGATVVAQTENGSKTVQTFEQGRLVETEILDAADAFVAGVEYAYDDHGRLEEQIDSRTGTTTYTYYDNDQTATVTAPDPDGAGPLSALVTAYTYDDLGRATEVTRPDSSVVHTEYTTRGEVAKTWGGGQYPVEYTYDAQGRRTSMTTWQDFNESTGVGVSGDATTTWEYDSQRGWLVRKEYDDGNGTDYTYTPAGRLDTRTWERGVVTTYGYDDVGRQTSVDYSDSTPSITYTHTRVGQPETVTDATGTRTFDYDADLRLDTEELDEDFYDDRVLTRLYEDGTSGTIDGRSAGFELGTAADPDQDMGVGYSYDSAGRLKTVSDGTDTFTYGYESDTRNLLAEVEGPAHTVTYQYEPGRNAVTEVENEETVGTASTVSQYTYRYNDIGQREDRVDTGSAFAQAALYDWSYDDLGQVTAADRYLGTDPDSPGSPVASDDMAYDYDFIGNRLTSTFGTDPQRSYTVDELNQYSGITNPSASPTHDDDGNMTYDGAGWWFEWNGENRMIEARNYAVTPSSGAKLLSFAYDYQGRRVAKTVETHDGSSWSTDSHERFIYDDWNLIATFEVQPSSLNLHTFYLWGQDLSGSMQGAGGVGGLLSVKEASGGDTFYPTYDANGNASEYLDDTGTAVAHYEYSPFGEVIRSTGSMDDDFVFRFSTKYQDSETGYLYYGFRYYDPETGRWASRDPLEEEGGLNLYAFNFNAPTNYIDGLGDVPALLWVIGKRAIGSFASSFAERVIIAYIQKIMDGSTVLGHMKNFCYEPKKKQIILAGVGGEIGDEIVGGFVDDLGKASIRTLLGKGLGNRGFKRINDSKLGKIWKNRQGETIRESVLGDASGKIYDFGKSKLKDATIERQRYFIKYSRNENDCSISFKITSEVSLNVPGVQSGIKLDVPVQDGKLTKENMPSNILRQCLPCCLGDD